MYKQGFNKDRYAFACAMLGLDDSFSWNIDDGYGGKQGKALGVNTNYSANVDEIDGLEDGNAHSLLMTDVEELVYENNKDTYPSLEGYYNAFLEADKGDDNQEKWKAFNDFRNDLYSKCGDEIYKYMILDKSDPDNVSTDGDKVQGFENADWNKIKNEFNYYVQLFDEITNSGGCVSIQDYTNNETPDNEWFNNIISTGQAVIDMWDEDKKEWSETSVATSYSNEYLQETEDTLGQKKAEAEYEYELSIINEKDKKFDKELSKLETERNSLSTEMESIKQRKYNRLDKEEKKSRVNNNNNN